MQNGLSINIAFSWSLFLKICNFLIEHIFLMRVKEKTCFPDKSLPFVRSIGTLCWLCRRGAIPRRGWPPQMCPTTNHPRDKSFQTCFFISVQEWGNVQSFPQISDCFSYIPPSPLQKINQMKLREDQSKIVAVIQKWL